MAQFDLDDLTTLKHSMFLLAIQLLACILISDTLSFIEYSSINNFWKKIVGDLDLDDLCFYEIWHLLRLCASYIHQMLTYCDYSLKVTIVYNFMKIVKIMQFLHNSACHVTPISKILSNLESRSQELENELLHNVWQTLLST